MTVDFRAVTAENIDTLYHLNRQMAVDEGQENLFTAEQTPYQEAFLSPHPFVFGYLLLDEDETPFGFIIYQKKFATYLAKKVFYIEDLYLGKRQNDPELFVKVLDELNRITQGYCRIEIRRLKHFAPPKEPLQNFKYHPISKWEIWRKERTEC